MNEEEWVEQIADNVRALPIFLNNALSIQTGLKLAYGFEISAYGADSEVSKSNTTKFETDLIIVEQMSDGQWKPRVVVEAKLASITTHDAITYSHKAAIHKAVHPYLRYGVMMGNREHYPLPGRLYRHGAQFDFMISFVGFKPTQDENLKFQQLLEAEVAASRKMERILMDSRKKVRDHYTVFHRRLELH